MPATAQPDNADFNSQVCELLQQMGEVLEQQKANPYRISAYLNAADAIRGLDIDVREVLKAEGTDGLVRLPFIGSGIAGAIRDIAETGHWQRLERLRGSLEPEQLLQTVPGIGPDMARAIHEQLQIDTLESLEIAAHDGRLQQIKGIGPRRAAAIRGSLAALLGRRPRLPRQRPDGPGVDVILAIDRDYRRRARAGSLKKIAPKRFNPTGKAWLPILHTDRGDWHFTAMFSNTARAHELGHTRDWVVIYCYDDQRHEQQFTVVNETRGPLKDLRVVRGREAECLRYYQRGSRTPVHRRKAG